MEIKVLRSFVAVATHRSFSRAAKELHTVQPAISRHITSLEDELGVKLFFRTSREVTITAAGSRLLQDATHLIEQNEGTKQAVIQAASGVVGSLKIGYLGGATLGFLPALVRNYLQHNPNIDVGLFEMTVSEQIEALEKHDLDIAFSRLLPAGFEDSYISTNIYTDKLVVAVSIMHPLSEVDEIDLSQLKSDPFILFKREQAVGLFDSIITQCQMSGFSPNIRKQPNQMQAVLTQVAAGLGVSIVPYSVKDLKCDECSFLSLKCNQAIDSKPIELPLVMTHHRHTHSPTSRVFVDLVHNEIDNIRRKMT
jgi:DNA-binding transcriptional LysR family regulator